MPQHTAQLLVSDIDYNLYGLCQPSGDIVWEFTPSADTHPPAVHNNIAYIGTCGSKDSKYGISAVNALSGNVLFKRPFQEPDHILTTGVVAEDGILLVCTTPKGDPFEGTSLIRAYSTEGHRLLWKADLPDVVFQRPIVCKSTIVVQTEMESLAVYSRETGEFLWEDSFNTNPPGEGLQPAASADRKWLYFVSDKCLKKYSPRDSTEQWEWTAPIQTRGTVAGTSQEVVVYKESKKLYGISQSSGETKWESEYYDEGFLKGIKNGVAYVKSDNSILAIALDTGEKLWEYEQDQEMTVLSATDKHLYFTLGNGDVHVLDQDCGKKVWFIDTNSNKIPSKLDEVSHMSQVSEIQNGPSRNTAPNTKKSAIKVGNM
jgi:outer membrane protein assembly factor BamB